MIKNMKINMKLLIAFIMIGIIPLGIFAAVGLSNMTSSSTSDTMVQLESIREAKHIQLEDFFSERKREAELLQTVIDTMKNDGQVKLKSTQELKKQSIENYIKSLETFMMSESKTAEVGDLTQTLQSNGGGSNATIAYKVNRYRNRLNELSKINYIQDVYIISTKGEVVFTQKQKDEIGTSITDGPYSQSGLAKTWLKVMDGQNLAFEDFSVYGANSQEMYAFFGAPIFDDNMKLVGILAAKIGYERFNELVHATDQLGDSAETYIAVSNENNFELRTDMYTMGDGKYVLGHVIDNVPEYAKMTFQGKSVNEIFKDSDGNMVVVSTNPITIVDTQWSMITKVDLEEFISPTDSKGGDYYTNYIQNHVYDDMFLIHPDGYVFYSVTKGFEYKKNILQGELSKTNHSKLVRDVNSIKDFVFVDYEANELSNYRPRAFVGLPVFDNEGQIEFIISFEVSSEAMNQIMLERTGLGDKGEAYLIGPDFRLRSDTFLEPLTKNISNSFKDIENGGIRSDAAFEVINGGTDTVIGVDYRGNKAIISYTPIDIYEQQWGLVVKQDSDEAFARIIKLIYLMIALGFITVLIVILVAKSISRGISKPIVSISEWAKKVAEGELYDPNISSNIDEIDEMNESLRKVVESFTEVANICEDIAIGRLDKKFKLRGDSDRLALSINNMRDNYIQVIDQANKVANNDYSVTIEKRSDNDELASALINMVNQLKEATDESLRQAWIKNGQSDLNKIIQDTNNNTELSKQVISYISKYLDAQTGVMMVKRDEEYVLLGSYAYSIRNSGRFKVVEGEGLIGQAILEKEIIYLKDVPNESLNIESASIHMDAKHVIVIPCVFENKVYGIMEIASYSPFKETQIEFLEKVQESIAIAIHSNITSEELKTLLDKTLIQSEELKKSESELTQKNEKLKMQTEALRKSEMQLQQQQEELRQSNEELAAQTMELKTSESKLQQQQEELRVTNEELEEKTLNLQKQKEEISKKNDELEKTQKLIQEKAEEIEISSKYKSEFLANMSHELRTPLNSILILSGFLSEDKNGTLTPKEKEYASVINSAGKDLLELINDILDLSKIESGKMDVNIATFDIREVLNELQVMIEPLTKQKGVNLLNNVDDSVPKTILSDRTKISQIIKNITSNAVKFTSEGEIEMTAKMIDNGMIEIAVRDTGIGIPEDKLIHIFGAFQQADGTTSRNYGGTGLGLSITKELTELLGGSIKVESELGKGSIFRVKIPVTFDENKAVTANKKTFKTNSEVKNTLPQEKNIVSVQSESEEGIINTMDEPLLDQELNIDFDKIHDSAILIIEDDMNFARILENIAKERGHEVIRVESGEKGLAVVDKVDVGAIILDLGLPGMNGWEVLHRLKKWNKTKDIPIHIMSGRELDSEHMNIGYVDYLKKPVSSEKLINAFEKIEEMVNKVIKKLLVVTSSEELTPQIEKQFGEALKDIRIDKVNSASEATNVLKNTTYDCIIIGTELEGLSAEEFVKKIRVNDIAQTPIIFYTDGVVTKEKNDELQRYVESIIIKGDKSLNRLIDETTLFLNHFEQSHRKKVEEYMKSSKEKEAVLAGKKVLIVDDDMRNTFALSSVFEDREMEVIIAKNGELAIEKLKENPDIDIILMDIMMPVMDGYTAMRKIKKMDEKFRQIPIIALTAKAMKEDKEKCISAGASDYLSKPIKIDELITLMKVWMY